MGKRNKSRHKQRDTQLRAPFSKSAKLSAQAANNLRLRKHWRLRHVIGVLTVIVGGATLLANVWQWWDSRRSHLVVDSIHFNIVDRELPPETDGRVTVFNYYNNTEKVALVSIGVAKSGNATPVNARALFQCKVVGARTPSDVDPFRFFQWDEARSTRHVIGPNSIRIDACHLAQDDALNSHMNITRSYIVGELRYEDGNGTAHVAQLAHQIIVERDSFTDFMATTKPVGQHNCSDDCPRE